MTYIRANFFALCIVALSLAASIQYFIQGDWRRGCYWLFASAISLTVTL